MTILRLILGDQLNAGHRWFREKRDDVCYVMMEIRSETDYVQHHAQKILAIFAAMRAFAAALEAAGHRVRYLRIGATENRQSFAENLSDVFLEHGVTSWARMEADEWRVELMLQEAAISLGVPVEVVDSEHFLLPRAELSEQFAKRVPRMEHFYRTVRRRFDILLDAQGKPVGGQWNFDPDNRARWPGAPAVPAWPWAVRNLKDLWEEIQQAGVVTIGEPNAEAFAWPGNRREAQTGLAHFINHALPYFGQYQDAMNIGAPLLFHSALSFALNVKMLQPREVIAAAVDAWSEGRAPIAAVEGFVRQIAGWREFVRGVYWARMPEYARSNALDAQRRLPTWFWSGQTHMRCLREAISQSLALAYAHHIQRLMVTGNFALLAGVHPDEVDAWYLGIYIDAFEWVELPNTRGMSQFADGGILGSKPYAASANYIGRQSDYCKVCRYDAKRRHGEGACPFNALYWDFIARHAAILGNNPRMSLPYRAWNALPPAEQGAIRQTARHYLEQLDTL
jgi:deoxyribodipyrimidine photolyase-related protein